MKRLMIRVLAFLLTLAIGLIASTFIISHYHPVVGPARVELKQAPASQPITFEDLHTMSVLTYHWFYSSDGIGVRYGCFDYGSPSDVAKHLQDTLSAKQIIDRTHKLNVKSEMVGERVVASYPDESYTEENIIWTEGSRLFRVIAPSMKHALEFEKSRAWAGKECLPRRAT